MAYQFNDLLLLLRLNVLYYLSNDILSHYENRCKKLALQNNVTAIRYQIASQSSTEGNSMMYKSCHTYR